MWETERGQEIAALAVDHLKATDPKAKKAFLSVLSYQIFPRQGSTGAQTKWVSMGSITRVTVWGQEHFLNNLRLAMVCENLGMGPQHYCIIQSKASDQKQGSFPLKYSC